VTRHAQPPLRGAAAPPPPHPGEEPPEPSLAERGRTLVHAGRVGTLATLSRRHPGHPFGSVMPYAPDAAGRPLLLISGMAMHTQNLLGDPRASLLVAERVVAPGVPEDPLALGRVTLLGRAERLEGPAAADARDLYLERHPRARNWVDFEDFAFWRLRVDELYVVGGFGAMEWIAPEAYAAAAPDPLADAAGEILAHMNADHAPALVAYARVLAGVGDAQSAEMVAVDRLGFQLRIHAADRVHGARIAFGRAVASAAECRSALIELLDRARAASA
jgi:putative heme iron utilization protein